MAISANLTLPDFSRCREKDLPRHDQKILQAWEAWGVECWGHREASLASGGERHPVCPGPCASSREVLLTPLPGPLVPVMTNLLLRHSLVPVQENIPLERWAQITCIMGYCFPIMEETVYTLGSMFGAHRGIKYRKDVVCILRKLKFLWWSVILTVC